MLSGDGRRILDKTPKTDSHVGGASTDWKGEYAQMYEVQGYVAGLGTVALINAGLAQGKNRSGLNWFLLSLLLGPIATFVLVAFFEKQRGE